MAAHRNMSVKRNRFNIGQSPNTQLVAGLTVLVVVTGWSGTAQATERIERSGHAVTDMRSGGVSNARAVGLSTPGPDSVKNIPCRVSDFLAAVTPSNAGRNVALRLAASCTYRLSGTTATTRGAPAIAGNVTVEGNGATIVGGMSDSPGCFRIFNVGAGGQLTVKDLTIEGGNTKCLGVEGSGPSASDGAGILVQPGGTAYLERVVLTNNMSGGDGGGIANFGTTTMVDCAIKNNSARRSGGGIYQGAGQLNVLKSSIGRNVAGIGVGGGLAAEGGKAEVRGGTVKANAAGGGGGGVASSGSGTVVSIIASTITENTSDGAGGGINNWQTGSFSIHESTVSHNKAKANGGGIRNANSSVLIDRVKMSANATTRNGGGVASEAKLGLAADVVIRRSTISGNLAFGPSSMGGGIFNDGTRILLQEDLIMFNISRLPAGGVDNTRGRVVLEGTAVVINAPSNCRRVPLCS